MFITAVIIGVELPLWRRKTCKEIILRYQTDRVQLFDVKMKEIHHVNK